MQQLCPWQPAWRGRTGQDWVGWNTPARPVERHPPAWQTCRLVLTHVIILVKHTDRHCHVNIMVKWPDNLPHDEPPVSWMNESHALVHRSGSSGMTNSTKKWGSINNFLFLSWKYIYSVHPLTFLPGSTDNHSGGGGRGTGTSPTTTTRGTTHGRGFGLGLGDTGRDTWVSGAGVSRCCVEAAIVGVIYLKCIIPIQLFRVLSLLFSNTKTCTK